jgi:predicted DNA-binding ribbon-helix-helix protein
MMKSSVVKRSIVIDGHKTSVSLEDAFWSGLKEIALAQGATLSEMIAGIDTTRQQGNLSSAIRLFVLDQVRNGTRLDQTKERDRVTREP